MIQINTFLGLVVTRCPTSEKSTYTNYSTPKNYQDIQIYLKTERVR